MQTDSFFSIQLGNVKIKIVLRNALYGRPRQYSPEYAPLHNHASFELHTIVNGGARLQTAEQSYDLTENDVVLIPPQTFHVFRPQEKATVMRSITFSLAKAEKTNEEDYDTQIRAYLAQEKNVIFLHHSAEMVENLNRAVLNLHAKTPFNKELTKAFLTLVFSELFSPMIGGSEFQINTKDTEDDTRIVIIEHYFANYYHQNASIGELAEILYLSEQQTRRIIQKNYGMGFQERLNNIRIQNAKQLLRDTALDIEKVADAVGYQSYNGFYLAFKKITSLTPLQFRKKIQKEL